MYNSCLYLKILSTSDNQNIIKMFFEDWVDTVFNREINYSVVGVDPVKTFFYGEIIRIDFKNQEDATVLKLKGIPSEFQNHLKFIEWN